MSGFLAGFAVTGWAQFEYDWPAHSALSEGQWFRIATTDQDYKVDVALLNALGLDPASVNPAAINLCRW